MVGKINKPSEKSAVEAQMKAFGEYLEQLRKKSRMSLGDLSEELRKHGAPKHGTSRQYLGALERGEVMNPSPKLLEDLAKALDELSADYWLAAGLLPPGDESSKEAYSALLSEAHKEGFTRMLKDEGLSETAIREVLSKVSDETIDRVVRREEPLLIDRGSLDRTAVAEHSAAGFEEHVVRNLSTDAEANHVGETGSEYLHKVKEKFSSKRAPQRDISATWGAKTGPQGTSIGAGPLARIYVNRHVSNEEAKALEAIGRAIEHLLKN